jgi:hypothetical protein
VSAEAGDDASVAYYLQRLAALQERPDRAVRMYAAAAALLHDAGTGWLHADVPCAPADDTILATLRSRIGEAPYEAARVEGAAMETGVRWSTRSKRVRQSGLSPRTAGRRGRRRWPWVPR